VESFAQQLLYWISKQLNTYMNGTKFKVGDRVYKPLGYGFPGIVVAVFPTTSGSWRVVAEFEGNGMLHIFNEGQLEKREPAALKVERVRQNANVTQNVELVYECLRG